MEKQEIEEKLHYHEWLRDGFSMVYIYDRLLRNPFSNHLSLIVGFARVTSGKHR